MFGLRRSLSSEPLKDTKGASNGEGRALSLKKRGLVSYKHIRTRLWLVVWIKGNTYKYIYMYTSEENEEYIGS